jgi:hypothetical protein
MQDASKPEAIQARGQDMHDLVSIRDVVSPCLHAMTSSYHFADEQFVPPQPTCPAHLTGDNSVRQSP